jgi:hypothetical protein
MSQSLWGTELAESPQMEPQSLSPRKEIEALALSADDFSALEERVHRAVELIKRERLARVAAEERAAKAEADLKSSSPHVDQLKDEIRTLRAERDQVRERVERLLKQLDALEL